MDVRPEPQGELRFDACAEEAFVRKQYRAVVIAVPNDAPQGLVDGPHRALGVPGKRRLNAMPSNRNVRSRSSPAPLVPRQTRRLACVVVKEGAFQRKLCGCKVRRAMLRSLN